ncbi:MAG: DUF1559 domain-containing protein, partial [Planctomycetia bacterium]
PVPNGTSAATNYDFVTNAALLTANLYLDRSTPTVRMFNDDCLIQLKDLSDGTSQTIAVAETTRRVYNGSTPNVKWGHTGWVMIGLNTLDGINDWSYFIYYNAPKFGQLGSWARMGSMHDGGCNMLFADGAVRFISQNTAQDVLNALGSIAGGEVQAKAAL